MITIRLTPDEVHAAAQQALLRRWRNLSGIARERTPANNQSACEWDNDVHSCGAELAFAKKLDAYPTGLGGVGFPDTTWGEVRWTQYRDTGGLIIYPNDDNNRRFVLIDGLTPQFNLIGWLLAKEGKNPDWWKPAKGYFLVPRENLHQFDAESLRLPGPAVEPTRSQAPTEPPESTSGSSAKASEQTRETSLDQ